MRGKEGERWCWGESVLVRADQPVKRCERDTHAPAAAPRLRGHRAARRGAPPRPPPRRGDPMRRGAGASRGPPSPCSVSAPPPAPRSASSAPSPTTPFHPSSSPPPLPYPTLFLLLLRFHFVFKYTNGRVIIRCVQVHWTFPHKFHKNLTASQDFTFLFYQNCLKLTFYVINMHVFIFFFKRKKSIKETMLHTKLLITGDKSLQTLSR